MKKTISWLAVLAGFLLGISLLACFGVRPVPDRDSSPYRLMYWLEYVGFGASGAVSLISSFLAIRNRLRAAVSFLAVAPIAGFCLAYPVAVMNSIRSGDVYQIPSVGPLVLVAIVYFALLSVPLIVFWQRKLGVIRPLGVALVVTACLSYSGLSRPASLLIPSLAGFSAPFFALGWFWLATDRSGWGPLVRPWSVSPLRRSAALLCGAALVYVLVCMGTIGLMVQPHFVGDCGGYPVPVVKQGYPEHTAFVARILHLGYPTTNFDGRKVSFWALASVRHHFWGLPKWNSRVVILSQYLYEENQEYFINGHREGGFRTMGLPVVKSARCGNSSRLQDLDAEIQLRVLTDGRTNDGVRIIGLVQGLPPRRPNAPASGVELAIAGPQGTFSVTTDRGGIFDVTGLPQGRYSVRVKNAEKAWPGNALCTPRDDRELTTGDVLGCHLLTR